MPVKLLWSDARADEFPDSLDRRVQVDQSDAVEIARDARPGGAAVVMTHSHALDFAITEAALAREDLAYVGLIGSRTKRRRFERWFTARGGNAALLDHLVCPIGNFGIDDKRPEVIAALVTTEVLQAFERRKQSGLDAAKERQEEGAVS